MKSTIYFKPWGFNKIKVKSTQMFILLSVIVVVASVLYHSDDLHSITDIGIALLNPIIWIYALLLIVYFMLKKKTMVTLEGVLTYEEVLNKIFFLFFSNKWIAGGKRKKKTLKLKQLR